MARTTSATSVMSATPTVTILAANPHRRFSKAEVEAATAPDGVTRPVQRG